SFDGRKLPKICFKSHPKNLKIWADFQNFESLRRGYHGFFNGIKIQHSLWSEVVENLP
ncbi:Hypothetical predicted protein, partial [Olea europaea subsp. europaea]